MESLWFEDVQPEQIWISPSRTITEGDVVNFAGLTGDFNPLHVDHDFASKSVYRQPIAHGLLGLSWVAGLGSTAPSMKTLAFTAVKQWQFLAPVFFGDTVHVKTRCLEKKPKGKRSGQILWERQLINQRDQVVQQGIFETLVAIEPMGDGVHKASPLKGPKFMQRAKADSAKTDSAKTDSPEG